MSSAIEEQEADLREDLRGLLLERSTPVEVGFRWIGRRDDLDGVTCIGDVVGKGYRGGGGAIIFRAAVYSFHCQTPCAGGLGLSDKTARNNVSYGRFRY
jgi:hypothetical protein